MKRKLFIWAFAILSLPLSAQFGGIDVESMVHNSNQYIGQQQNEIGSIIKSDVEAQIRQRQAQTVQNQQTQLRQQQTRTTQQQALENFNSRISAEGQQRMEYYSNPDNYIDRSITNRRPSFNTNSTNRYNSSNQPRDLRTRPVHSEELTSKSLQMLREANGNYFSDENREVTIDHNARVQLFDAPSLGEYKPLEKKPSRVRQFLNEQARKEAERKALENEVAHNNGIIDLIKDGTGLVLGATMKSGAALISANLNLYAELVKYTNECSAGAKQTKEFNDFERFLGIDKVLNWLGPELTDSYEIITNASYKTAVDVLTPWVGDKIGVAYVGMEKVGTYSWDMLNSMQIGFSISDYAVTNEKHEE